MMELEGRAFGRQDPEKSGVEIEVEVGGWGRDRAQKSWQKR